MVKRQGLEMQDRIHFVRRVEKRRNILYIIILYYIILLYYISLRCTALLILSILYPLSAFKLLLARDALVRTNRHVCQDVRPSVCPSVCLGRACIVIVRWRRFKFQCSGHPDSKARPPTPNSLFPVPPGREVWSGCAN